MSPNDRKLIAVIGATGQQGGGVVRALQASGQFKVRALSRNPGKHRQLAEEVVQTDLDRPETLNAAFAGADGVFLVTNFGQPGTDEFKQATAAVREGQCRDGHQLQKRVGLSSLGGELGPATGFELLLGVVVLTADFKF